MTIHRGRLAVLAASAAILVSACGGAAPATNAPSAVLDTVLAAYPSIPQRRASRTPWRFPTMNRFALPMGAALAIVLGVVLIAPRLVNQVGTHDCV